MYKKQNKTKIIGIIISILLIFLMIYLISNKEDDPLSKFIKDIIYSPTRLIPNKDVLNISLNKALEEENKELKNILKIKNSLIEFDIIPATIIERNTSYWFNTIRINKGMIDGVKEGMAVVSDGNLIGYIESTSKLTSTIKLITSNDKTNKISVKIITKSTSINSILSTLEDGSMIIDGINQDTDIEVGNIVQTSGLSDIFPSAIPIGKIDKITFDKYGISKVLYVKPLTNLDNIHFISVLSRKIS